MTVPSSAELNIKSVDEFAFAVYRRASASGTEFANVARTARALQRALGHVHSEARDPDSVLNQPGTSSRDNPSAAYARQLTSLIQDSDFALKQADTILIKYGDGANRAEGHTPHEADVRERDNKINLVQKELASQKTRIDLFLDTVQLHPPTKNQEVLQNTNAHELDRIKDKVDSVATRIFRQRVKNSPGDGTEEDAWQGFKVELEKEGFSSEILHRNKEVLRAYIRELESYQQSDHGSPPSVRGLLARGPLTAPHSAYDGLSGQQSLVSHATPRQLDPSVPQSLQPFHHSQPPLVNTRSSGLSYDPPTSSDSDEMSPGGAPRTALISTRDLMLIDQHEAEMVAARMASMRLPPGLPPPNYSVSPGTSPITRYLPAGAPPPLLPGPGHDMQLSTSPRQQFGTSPRYVPPLVPPYPGALSPTSSIITPPPAYGSSPSYPASSSFPTIPAPPVGGALVPHGQSPRQYSRLAPDSRGQEIPLDAKWTKIKRSLVSPVVLERAGVRYEARPDFVAILGILTRDKVAEYARQSAEVRNARRAAPSHHDKPKEEGERRPETYRDREKRKARRGLASDDESDVLWDSDSGDDRKRKPTRGRRASTEQKESGTRSSAGIVPVIVSPPSSVNGEDRASPSSTIGPKPILKNRNPNHVRFDGDGAPREIRPGDYRDRSRDDRNREGDRSRGDRRDRDRDREKDRDQRDRPRRDRDRDKDRDHRHRHRDHDRSEQARDRERGERGDRDDKDKGASTSKRSSLKDTFGAAGIGGAAATLLSVLTDAAVHL